MTHPLVERLDWIVLEILLIELDALLIALWIVDW